MRWYELLDDQRVYSKWKIPSRIENREITMSILFLGKRNDPYTDDAASTVSQLFDDVTNIRVARGETLPEEAVSWTGDWLISYLCPLVIPKALLNKARAGAINFHPGPPEYPGIGCTNFALYNKETAFGVTCHYMAPNVDSGEIIAVSRFPIYDKDSVYTLTRRCYAYQIQLFHEVVGKIRRGEPLKSGELAWQRKPYTMVNFDALRMLAPDMPEDEIHRRIRATTFKGYTGPILRFHGHDFVLQSLHEPLPLD